MKMRIYKTSLLFLLFICFTISNAFAGGEDIQSITLNSACTQEGQIARNSKCTLTFLDCCANDYHSGPEGLRLILEYRPITGKVWRKKGAEISVPRCGGSFGNGFGACSNPNKLFKLDFRADSSKFYRIRSELLGSTKHYYSTPLSAYGYVQYFPILTTGSKYKECRYVSYDKPGPQPFYGLYDCH